MQIVQEKSATEAQLLSLKGMRNYFFISIVSILLQASFFQTDLSAQAYMTTAGIRTGNSFGLTVNQRLLKRTTVEGILQNHFVTKTTYLHILARQHKSLISRRLNGYIGGGVHLGLQNQPEASGGVAGLDGVLGLEFTAMRLSVSADFKPQLTYGQGIVLNTGVSVRYVLFKDEVFRRWDRKRKKAKRKKNGTRIWDRINI